MAVLIQELVKIVLEISKMDEMLEKVQSGVPEGEQAQKWHEVSIRALAWSREALATRQADLLVQMQRMSQGQLGKVAKPTPTPSPAAQTPTACGAPPAAALTTQAELRSDGAEHVGSLRNDLEKLKAYAPGCCILVRRIKQLGLHSPERLRDYFSRFGEVENILVAHSFEKPSSKRRQGRIRPAALGFVVMGSQSAAEEIFSQDEWHVVGEGEDSCRIQAQRYEPSGCAEDLLVGGETPVSSSPAGAEKAAAPTWSDIVRAGRCKPDA